MKKNILLITLISLTLQLHTEEPSFPTYEIPKKPHKPIEFPTIRTEPVALNIPKRVGEFKGKLYAKKINKNLRNLNKHHTRIFKAGHKNSFSLDIKLPHKEERRFQKQKHVKIPKITLSCKSKKVDQSRRNLGPDAKDNAFNTDYTSFSKSFKLDEQIYKGSFYTYQHLTGDIKGGSETYISEALLCTVSIKENKQQESKYDYVEYTLSFFDHGRN